LSVKVIQVIHVIQPDYFFLWNKNFSLPPEEQPPPPHIKYIKSSKHKRARGG